ncbi:hypothetical protein GCM10007388_44580 [Pseudoduganella plicata]|uniref:Uncharacterized protein n=1 Tax=Pseudoduganella plicata TaxID=321984 RepID=A0AA88CA67_9BURK|nr:hypothetical protein GCM10007388_44580 [Pseudoduganella plicata]
MQQRVQAEPVSAQGAGHLQAEQARIGKGAHRMLRPAAFPVHQLGIRQYGVVDDLPGKFGQLVEFGRVECVHGCLAE